MTGIQDFARHRPTIHREPPQDMARRSANPVLESARLPDDFARTIHSIAVLDYLAVVQHIERDDPKERVDFAAIKGL
jgi:hypothetical protein